MKKVILFLLVFSTFLFGQEKTLLGNFGEISHGGFGAPVTKITSINGEFGVLCGVRGGWIINHSLSLGLGGYGLVTNSELANGFDGQNRYLEFGYGGFEFEYILASNEVVHLTFSGLIGGGEVDYRFNKIQDHDYDDEHSYERDDFFVAEPSLNAELNITSFFRINLGVGYRFVSGIENSFISENKLNDMTGTVQFKFGSF